MVFRSLTDFKTPVYIYLIVPLINIFGLTSFTVRFPSFFFSILTIPILFWLIKELILVSKLLNNKTANWLSILACLLLAISPWHILFGRTNFECNVALFFYLAGVLTFYKSLKNPRILLLSSVMFAIAIPAYHSQRIITPLTILFLAIRFRKTLFADSHKVYLSLGVMLGLIITLPTLSVVGTPGFLARASGLNIFSHTRQMPDGFLANYHGILNPIINGSWFLSVREFCMLYFSYLSPRYMFVLGDSGPRSSFPELSTYFLWQFPFYLYGLWTLLKNKKLRELKFFTLFLLLISPVPAAVTRDPYTTIRALPLVIPQVIVIAIGIFYLTKLHWLTSLALRFSGVKKVKDYLLRPVTYSMFVLIIVYSLYKLYSSVIILNEHYRAKSWDYGWEEVVETVKDVNPNLPIIVDNARSDAYPQIAFFLKYDPVKFQKENYQVSPEEYYTNMNHKREWKVGNYEIRAINWEKDLFIDEYLVGDELSISLEQIERHELTLIKEIDYPDGTPAYRIVRTNPNFAQEEQRLFNLTSEYK